MRQFFALCAIVVLLAGCSLDGGTSSTATTSPGTTATDTPGPTATTDTSGGATDTPVVGVTTTPTFTPLAGLKNCGSSFPHDGILGYIGDMIISQPHDAFLSYPGLKLPDNLTGGAPYIETTSTSTAGLISAPPPSGVTTAAAFFSSGIPTWGSGGGGFVVNICNSSTTATHTLQSLGMQITAFAPDTATNVNVQAGCDQAVSAKQGPMGGCGGSLGPSDQFTATWASGAPSGTSVTLKQTTNQSTTTILPATVAPTKVYTAFIGMNYPGKPGTYTFQFGMQVDTVPLAYLGGTTYPLFMAAGAHVWSGSACWSNASWKAQVLASTSGYYLCPQP
jgi:hypothetical protein